MRRLGWTTRALSAPPEREISMMDGGRNAERAQAAERVLRARAALAAHRYGAAPTAEDEYRRALEAYFDLAERALLTASADDEAPLALAEPTDPGDRETDEDDARIEEATHRLAAIAGHYAAARRAVRLARSYRGEPGSSGRRERECIAAVARHRDAIRRLRLALRGAGEQLALPGLAKTRPMNTPARIAQSGR